MSNRLYLSPNRKLGGVCAGIAEYLGLDPTVVRLLWLIAFFIYGFGIMMYFICWIVIPKRPHSF